MSPQQSVKLDQRVTTASQVRPSPAWPVNQQQQWVVPPKRQKRVWLCKDFLRNQYRIVDEWRAVQAKLKCQNTNKPTKDEKMLKEQDSLLRKLLE